MVRPGYYRMGVVGDLAAIEAQRMNEIAATPGFY
jgi:hypothetical protein